MPRRNIALSLCVFLSFGLIGSYVLAQEFNLQTMQMTMKGIDPSLSKYESGRFAVSVEYYSLNYKPFDDFSRESARAYGGYKFSKKVAEEARVESNKPKSNMAQYKEPLNNAKATLNKSTEFASNLVDTGTKLISDFTTASIPGINIISLLPKLLSILQSILDNLKTIQTEGPKLMQSISSMLKTIAV